ncbi:MAG: betaine/proline/choline family ABC transporter ATP-binding protein [Acidimicrobiia bacterium]
MTIEQPADALISLEGVSKIYPGTTIPAVAELSMDIPEGEILVLVGPSGCGKSTTLRLINRMIEPSAGRIIFEGEDVTDVNPDQLRRRIGYVIQQIGLFPHMTIAENIATVPRLLKWDESTIDARIDELLDMVGMDPSIYRSRYPKELSGGQAQRVGVARALGADPDVLLMDEPFGAIDPITRDRLQNEFLRLQAELRKTIVFVTHDIDEAIKMGDRIAILREQSVIAQLDTPERILANPADDFVDDFLGSGSTLKGLSLVKVSEVDIPDGYPTVQADVGREEALRLIRSADDPFLLVLDDQGRPLRWVAEPDIDRSDRSLADAGKPVRITIDRQTDVLEALEQMLHSAVGTACVVDGKGRYEGALQIETLTDLIRDLQASARRPVEEASA